MSFIPVMAKLKFQQLLLQSSVSHDPSEFILIWWFGAMFKKHFWLLMFLIGMHDIYRTDKLSTDMGENDVIFIAPINKWNPITRSDKVARW